MKNDIVPLNTTALYTFPLYLSTISTRMEILTTLWAPVSPSCISSKSLKHIHLTFPKITISLSNSNFTSVSVHSLNPINLSPSRKPVNFICSSSSGVSTSTTNYEFSDESNEVELRLFLGDKTIQSSKYVSVDIDEKFLTIKTKHNGSFTTAMEISLYEKIKPAETMLLDDDQLVVNLKKQDPDVKWPDITETWESLTVGVTQLLKGTSIYLVGESSEINHKISRELVVGLGRIKCCSRSRKCHIRKPKQSYSFGCCNDRRAATSGDQWRHLYAGFTVWLSQSDAKDEEAAKEEARMNVEGGGGGGFGNADVVVKIGGWDSDYSKAVAQATLSALKQLILSNKKLPGKKGLYIRLGCRGDWPNIQPPGDHPIVTRYAVRYGERNMVRYGIREI
ncbi:hypothetical protein LXL04_035547 [Taraxacum kok-saghyz]